MFQKLNKLLPEFSSTTIFRVYRKLCQKINTSGELQFCWQKDLVDERGERKTDTLVQAHRKAKDPQVTMCYNSATQNSIFVHTVRQTESIVSDHAYAFVAQSTQYLNPIVEHHGPVVDREVPSRNVCRLISSNCVMLSC